jgi:hypothetical protein
VGKAKCAHHNASSSGMVGAAQMRLGPPYVVSALNLAKNRFSAFAALQGVR